MVEIFKVFMVCFEFGMMRSHYASQNVRIWAWVMGDDEVVAIVCRVEVILHCEAKMSFPS